jgi:TonB family protein
LRRQSAAIRHLAWLAALAGVLMLPLAALLVPQWRPAVSEEVRQALGTPVLVVDVVAGEASAAVFDPVWIWAAGCLLLFLRDGRDRLAAGQLARRAEAWPEAGAGVRVSRDTAMPLVCGMLRPVIVLPQAARSWPAERLRIVLAHESMHVERRDTLTQFLGQVARAVYWPNPLAWWALARMRAESERAADDGVVSVGDTRMEYAGHLVEIVRAAEGRAAHQGAIAMARKSLLEERLRALMNPRANRRGVSMGMGAAAGLAVVVLLTPLAALKAPAQTAGGAISGVVRGPGGVAVAKANVKVTRQEGGTVEFTRSGEQGGFSLAPLPEGSYELTITAEGRPTVIARDIKVGAGQPAHLEFTLGAAAEAAAPPAEPKRREVVPAGGLSEAPLRINVGGNVQQANLVTKINPVYPADCKKERVEGSVLLKAVIGKSGDVLQLEPVNRLVDQRLVDAAILAVQGWRYRPTLLNGNPVEVSTQVMVNFTLAP